MGTHTTRTPRRHTTTPRRLITALAATAMVASVLLGVTATPAASADFVVTSTADLPLGDVTCPGSPCTLRGAVQAANGAGGGPHTITLGAGTHVLSLVGAEEDDNATGDLDVTVPLQIVGAGPGATIIDASTLGDRILDVHGLASLSIQGVHLTGGGAPLNRDGGAINSTSGTITVTNSALSDNRGDDGGAIDMSGGSTLTITNSTFAGNVAADDGGAIALNSGSKLTIVGSTFSNNTASDDGGALKLNSGGELSVATSTFTRNTATSDGGAISLNSSATVTIADSTLSDNTAGRHGGAIETAGSTSVEIQSSTFAGNTADRNGGAIDSGGDVSLTASTLSNNVAGDDGGAIEIGAESSVTTANTTISSNIAGKRGGAVRLGFDSTIDALHTTIVANRADAAGSAGGLDGPTLELTNSIVADNIGGDCVVPATVALGVNIDGDGSCGLGAGHLSATDPVLGPLASNGGPTRTHLPLLGSPAIDSADTTPCLPTDQRGVLRPQAGIAGGEANCDIGSVERTACGTVPFIDVPLGHPFCPEITWMAEEGITRGYDDGTYRPTANVTRQAMVAFLYRLDGESLGPDPTCTVAAFPDVPTDSTFCGHITWARDEGIVAGFNDGTFRPGAPVTRQALAAFLYRSAGSTLGAEPTCGSQQFTDVPLDHPFCGEIGWMVSVGLVNGFPDGTYRGGNPISRQAMSAFVFRFALIGGEAT